MTKVLTTILISAFVFAAALPSLGQVERVRPDTAPVDDVDEAHRIYHAEKAGRAVNLLTTAPLHPNGLITSRALALPPELRDLVAANLIEPDLETQQWVASQPGVKIAVKKEGLYRVTRSQLMNAGFDLSGDPANWRLFMNGIEQAIIVGAGGQFIEFLGRGIDTRESDTRIYYLIAGDIAGKRIVSRTLRPVGGNVISNSYGATTKLEENLHYYPVINGELDNYFGRVVVIEPTSIQFNATALDTTVPRYVLTVKLLGIQGADHRVKVVLNGQELGFMSGGVLENFAAEFLVPSGFFVEGANVLTLNETIQGRASFFDSVSLSYARGYQAEQNAASFYTPGYRKVDLKGFTTSDIRLFDTTFDASPTEISNLYVVNENGSFTVKLPSSRPMVMYGATEAAVLTPAAVTANTPSTLSTANNNADFVIISHSSPDFIAASETWADYRRSSAGGGVTAKVVDIVDVYDEFSYGVSGAAAIKSFLSYANENWITPPRYVLLMGDASRDPRNYEGYGYHDNVPTSMVPAIFEETGSDDALADFDDDGIPEIAIGRIPVRSASDIMTVLNKTKAFETPTMQSLGRGALFAYDYGFYPSALALANELPADMRKVFVGRGLPFPNEHTPDPNAQANLINGINSGKFIVNFSGHTSLGLWASPNFFGIGNVPSLTNADRPSIFTALKGYNGMFFAPQVDSLMEALLKAPNGGAVATWAATAQTTPNHELILSIRFYSQLGIGQIKRMGDLVRDAKSAIPGDPEVVSSWALLGDPMLQVRADEP